LWGWEVDGTGSSSCELLPRMLFVPSAPVHLYLLSHLIATWRSWTTQKRVNPDWALVTTTAGGTQRAPTV
jgi:hypothetical protein